jgi:hypothetical protein
MPNKQIFFNAQSRIYIDRMNSVGAGDEDVNTKSGRSTYVTVRAGAPVPAAGGREIQVYLDYHVEEVAKDYTELQAQAVATIYLESGMTFNSFGAGFTPASYNETIRGQIHNWIDITAKPGIAGSIISWCRIKIDGSGDDHRGNARLDAHISIPVVANVWIENPPSGGQTNEGTDLLSPLTMHELGELKEKHSSRFVDIIQGKALPESAVKVLTPSKFIKLRDKVPA